MSLIDIKVDMSRCAVALERIAASIERYLDPPLVSDRPPCPIDFISVDPAAIAQAEAEDDRRREVGTLLDASAPPEAVTTYEINETEVS